jgi:hypothetical protein
MKNIVDTVEKIIGLIIDKDLNVFWPHPHRNAASSGIP